jgi:putative sporulation protein YyaC
MLFNILIVRIRYFRFFVNFLGKGQPKSVPETFKFNSAAPNELYSFTNKIIEMFLEKADAGSTLVILCIGSDRSTGDSLGPLTGSLLCKLNPTGTVILGTLKNPVHAVNLEKTVAQLYKSCPVPFVVAVDACLGQLKSVGFVELGYGPLSPGSGVNKTLPPVGDIYISGVVNVGGFLEQMVLQNTRLYKVFSLAEFISKGLFLACQARNKTLEGSISPMLKTNN